VDGGAVVVAVTGIVVSGVLEPVITSSVGARHERRRFAAGEPRRAVTPRRQ